MYSSSELKTDSFGNKLWYDKNGKLHREDGPAYIQIGGATVWYKHGLRHREDGPAQVYPDGTEYWYYNGKLHREDGPAITYGADAGSTIFYYYNGIRVKCNSTKEFLRIIALKAFW